MLLNFIPKKKEDLIFIGGIITFLFLFIEIDPYSFAIDDYGERYFSKHEFNSDKIRNIFLSEGRWNLYLITLILTNILGASNSLISISFFCTKIFQIQLAYCSWLTANFFELSISDRWLILFFLLLAVHPYFAEIQTFKTSMVLNITCLRPIGIIGTILLFRKRFFEKAVGIFLLFYSISAYQGIINISFVLILIKGLNDIINKKNLEKTIKDIFRAFFLLIIAIFLYLIINKLVLFFFGQSLSTRGAIGSPIDIIKNFVRLVQINPAFLKDIGYLLIPGFIGIAFNYLFFKHNLKKETTSKILSLLLLTFLSTLSYIFILEWMDTYRQLSKFGKIVSNSSVYISIFLIASSSFYFIFNQIKDENFLIRSILIAILIPITFLATAGINLALASLYLPYRIYTGIGFFLGGIIAIYYSNIKIFPHLKKITIILSSVIVLSYTFSTNAIMFESFQLNQLDRNKANRIVATIEKIPDFKEKRILIVSKSWNQYDQPIHTKAGDLNESAFNRSWSKLQLLEFVSGYDLLDPIEEDIKLLEHNLIKEKAIWPEKESIIIKKDLIIIFL